MITIVGKTAGVCELDGKECDEVYHFSVQGEQGNYQMCIKCLKRILDMRLSRAGAVKAQAKLPVANNVPAGK